MAVMSYTVQQVSRYTPVADELETMLKIIQNDWGCKVISVCETTVNKTPDCSSQAFIIIYDNTPKDLQPAKRGHWEEREGYGGWGDTYFHCSVCGSDWVFEEGTPKANEWDYCPKCGADMRGVENG